MNELELQIDTEIDLNKRYLRKEIEPIPNAILFLAKAVIFLAEKISEIKEVKHE